MNKLVPIILAVGVATACKKSEPTKAQPAPTTAAAPAEAKPSAPPPLDPNNIVSIAVASKDHTTLVAALKAADYVTAIANPGPLTVFAPTDAAFAALPAGTVEDLLKPENKDKLVAVLTYHVVPGKVMAKDVAGLKSAKTVNGAELTIDTSNGVKIDGATVVKADIEAANGVIHVIDTVVIPK